MRGEYAALKHSYAELAELPPRARRIPQHTICTPLEFGTTSACAENTGCGRCTRTSQWNYLRVRGEYQHLPGAFRQSWELPPRARRILAEEVIAQARMGTTSACAENTSYHLCREPAGGNYLRVRGEYAALKHSYAELAELPPRARRIPQHTICTPLEFGTTSACAENTGCGRCTRTSQWNYLRVRGEYQHLPGAFRQSWELPPRARRILAEEVIAQARMGTTSACAENTFGGVFCVFVSWNYLRVRGEYNIESGFVISGVELPPRARRIPWDALGAGIKYGTTSACAENTRRPGRWGFSRRNYLRVRGEYPMYQPGGKYCAELPPRARRIPLLASRAASASGTTSACAENT